MYGIIINAPYSVLIFLMIRLLLIINRKRVMSEMRSDLIFHSYKNNNKEIPHHFRSRTKHADCCFFKNILIQHSTQNNQNKL